MGEDQAAHRAQKKAQANLDIDAAGAFRRPSNDGKKLPSVWKSSAFVTVRSRSQGAAR